MQDKSMQQKALSERADFAWTVGERLDQESISVVCIQASQCSEKCRSRTHIPVAYITQTGRKDR